MENYRDTYLGGGRGGGSGEGVGRGVGGCGGQDGDVICLYSNTSFYRIGKMHIAIVSTHHAHVGIHMHMYLITFALRTIFEKDTSHGGGHGGGVSTRPSVSVECEVMTKAMHSPR